MQPLKATARPSSASTIGWAPRSERSMIFSRRWPRATPPWAKSPDESGPRRCIVSAMAATATGSAAPPVRLISPLNPHTTVNVTGGARSDTPSGAGGGIGGGAGHARSGLLRGGAGGGVGDALLGDCGRVRVRLGGGVCLRGQLLRGDAEEAEEGGVEGGRVLDVGQVAGAGDRRQLGLEGRPQGHGIGER